MEGVHQERVTLQSGQDQAKAWFWSFVERKVCVRPNSKDGLEAQVPTAGSRCTVVIPVGRSKSRVCWRERHCSDGWTFFSKGAVAVSKTTMLSGYITMAYKTIVGCTMELIAEETCLRDYHERVSKVLVRLTRQAMRVERQGGGQDLPTPPVDPSKYDYLHLVLHNDGGKDEVQFDEELAVEKGGEEVVAILVELLSVIGKD